MNCIHLGEDGEQWQALVNKGIILKVHQSGMNPVSSAVHKRQQQEAEAFNSGDYILNCNKSTTENEYVKLFSPTVRAKQ